MMSRELEFVAEIEALTEKLNVITEGFNRLSGQAEFILKTSTEHSAVKSQWVLKSLGKPQPWKSQRQWARNEK